MSTVENKSSARRRLFDRRLIKGCCRHSSLEATARPDRGRCFETTKVSPDMKVLVINSGSSSLKYELFDMSTRASLAAGVAERIGESESRFHFQCAASSPSSAPTAREIPIEDHRRAIELMSRQLADDGQVANDRDLLGVGHRVVHGGERFRKPTVVDEEVIAEIRRQIPLAPLHNPANLIGIESVQQSFPATPQVAVFDTAFHQTMPPRAYRYAIPEELYQRQRIRRYGFHGTSHQFVARRAAALLGRPHDDVNLVVLHLGNGASASAIQAGQCVDTSMGLTPLEGLIMGTRCGDLDPGVLLHLGRALQLPMDEIDAMLNKQSGLIGICGENDMREVLLRASRGDGNAELAVDMYAYRIRKYIGAYFAALPHVDAIVFTAGIGENSPEIRRRACQPLSNLNVKLCLQRNEMRSAEPRKIHADDSGVAVLVVPTNEELEIAEQTVQCIHDAEKTRAEP